MAIPERFLEELIARNDIVDVVSGYVNLTKHSGSNLFGLCPFHNEKTPSFSVSRDKQIYHCFGCGKGGGVISFLMEAESLSFPEAVEALAKRVGMTVPDEGNEDPNRSRRARMLEMNRDAAKFFHENLKAPECRSAMEYIARRQISREMVTRFGLGAAPDLWDTLIGHLTKKGYDLGEMVDAGLVKRGQHGAYDMFRNRLIFPVIDVRGNVIGFSGRILGDGEPKYLNSPDTLVFQKSKNLFAMNLAKKTKRDALILVEGNVDVVSLHQAGFDCAVASLGTSLTPEQARLMTRYTQKAIISYDSDGAGVKAAQRAIGILESVGLEVRVLKMQDAKDPDEFIKAHGGEAFQLLLDKSENQVEYRLAVLKGKFDLSTDEGRIGYISGATELLAWLPSAVEREVFGRKVAEETGISPQAVAVEVQKAFRKRTSAQQKKLEREETRPIQTLQPREKALRYDVPASGKAEAGIIALLLHDPDLHSVPGLDASVFTSEFYRRVYEEVIRRSEAGEKVSIPLMAQSFSTAEISQLTDLQQQPLAKNNTREAMQDYLNKISTERLKKADTGDNDVLRQLAEKYRQTKGYGG